MNTFEAIRSRRKAVRSNEAYSASSALELIRSAAKTRHLPSDIWITVTSPIGTVPDFEHVYGYVCAYVYSRPDGSLRVQYVRDSRAAKSCYEALVAEISFHVD